MSSPLELQRDVVAELAWEPVIDGAQIGVEVRGDVVTLKGHVDNLAQKQSAERAAKRVRGVRGLVNKLEVRYGALHQPDDTDIAAAAVRALRNHSTLAGLNITPTVDHGWLTLEGSVQWQHQKALAASAVEHLRGLRGMTNSLTLSPRVRPENVERGISAALHRSATRDAAGIEVDTYGTKVILSGAVRSWAEYEDVEWAAWSAAGVTEVENRVAVVPGEHSRIPLQSVVGIE